MKIDRLLAIVMVLVNKRRVKAQELAMMFDVSIRTIYRDIDTINMAGIPIVTFQGLNGGIGLAEGYKLDKNVLTTDELSSIAVALKSMSYSLKDTGANWALEKIQGIIPKEKEESFKEDTEQLFIDLSSWDNDTYFKNKFYILKSAIKEKKSINFKYYSTKYEETVRKVDPYTLVLKSQKWYLYAFCHMRNDFRLFKISRMKEIDILKDTFSRESINLENLPWEKGWKNIHNEVTLRLKFDVSIKPMIEE